MKLTDMTIEEMCTTTEKQSFDRKSSKIEATAIATPMIAFANADGGLLAVGIEDNGEITGIDEYTLRISMKYFVPDMIFVSHLFSLKKKL